MLSPRRISLLVSLCLLSEGSSTDLDSSKSQSLRSSSKKEGTPSATADVLVQKLHLREEFDEWVERFEKFYESAEEELERFVIWVKNHEFIEKHNSENKSYRLAHNQFSAMTNEEYRQLNFLGSHSPGIMRTNKNKQYHFAFDDDVTADERRRKLKKSIDWRKEGAVTGIKNQGACGSCWAFSSTGALEGAHFLKTGSLVSLSEQNLLDCDNTDLGCMGGLMDQAFAYDEMADGLCTEEDYPYVARKHDSCMVSNCTLVPDTGVQKYYDVRPGSTHSLMLAINQQPVSVAVEADTMEFQFYSDGVFDSEACGINVDHAVLAVGYDTDAETGKDYFVVKNSWGEVWGDEGYIKIAARGSIEDTGTCGILTIGSVPVVD